jgi:hypothetical protein
MVRMCYIRQLATKRYQACKAGMCSETPPACAGRILYIIAVQPTAAEAGVGTEGGRPSARDRCLISRGEGYAVSAMLNDCLLCLSATADSS